jgi:hypothetical protein
VGCASVNEDEVEFEGGARARSWKFWMREMGITR